MNKLVISNIALVLFCIFFPASLFAAPTEESLLEAWENIQKKDPKTIIFEKISSGRYRFKTERFPFDGELEVLNITIDERMGAYDYGYIMGVVEVELLDLPEDFLEKYSYSYSAWLQKNILYYDKENEQWLSDKEYYGKIQQKNPSRILMDVLNLVPSLVYFFLFFILLVIVLVVQRKNKKYIDWAQELNKRQVELAEESHKLAKKNQKLLLEILKELKKRR
jgi:hypothetical protein